jgi:hypothetical protein
VKTNRLGAFSDGVLAIIITNKPTGNFPGSPIELDFVFTIQGDKIVSLEPDIVSVQLDVSARDGSGARRSRGDWQQS